MEKLHKLVSGNLQRLECKLVRLYQRFKAEKNEPRVLNSGEGQKKNYFNDPEYFRFLAMRWGY